MLPAAGVMRVMTRFSIIALPRAARAGAATRALWRVENENMSPSRPPSPYDERYAERRREPRLLCKDVASPRCYGERRRVPR